MQLISALTALAGLQFAVAFPSSALNGMGDKHLVARNVTSGSMLCTDKIQKGNCETLMVDYVANPGSCSTFKSKFLPLPRYYTPSYLP